MIIPDLDHADEEAPMAMQLDLTARVEDRSHKVPWVFLRRKQLLLALLLLLPRRGPRIRTRRPIVRENEAEAGNRRITPNLPLSRLRPKCTAEGTSIHPR
jgi:hypothetical protein